MSEDISLSYNQILRGDIEDPSVLRVHGWKSGEVL